MITANPRSTKRRVLFLVPSLRRAGAETQVIDLANTLDGDAFDKHLAYFEAQEDQLDRVDTRNVRVHRMTRRRKLDLDLAAHLARVVDDNEIELVHCTLQISLFIAILARLRTRARPRLVVAVHTTVNRSLYEELYDRLLYRRMIRRCDSVIFVCQAQAKHWIRKYPEIGPLATVVYNGVNTSVFDPAPMQSIASGLRDRLGIAPEQLLITCIAGLRPEKGHVFLLEAFAALSGEPRLVLAGDGPERRRIETLAAQLGVLNRVTFLGELADVRAVIAASDVTVLASTAVETFSMAMLESMAMAVPVVATDVGGLKEAISAGSTGDLVPAANATELRLALQRMLDDGPARRAMGRRAREIVQAQFSQRQMAEATAGLLKRVVDAHREPATRSERSV